MSSQRIKGQEVSVIIVQDGQVQAELTDIKNFEVEFQMEVISQGYLGETTERKDSIFKGCKVSCEVDSHSQDWIPFVQAIMDKVRRKKPDTVFNITATLNYPNGQTPTVTFPDIAWGAIPFSTPDQKSYVKHKFEGEVSEPDLQTS